MDHITIPIPEGMDERQKADLTAWLTKQVAEHMPQRLPCEDDPAWQAETLEGIRRGVADVEAGRVRPAKEALQEIAERLGLKIDR